MAVNLSIKNVPDELAEKLRQRAERNHRSLQRELMAIIELAAEPSRAPMQFDPAARDPAQRRISVEEMRAKSRELFPKGTHRSVDFIRSMRDSRYGEEWARTGVQPEPKG
jgi:plasmid stability protein